MGREQKPPGPTWPSPSRIKELSPEPGPSAPELCGPSTGSTLCRTWGREGDLQMVPKVGNLQPSTPQEFPFPHSPLSLLLCRNTRSGSWPCGGSAKTPLISSFMPPQSKLPREVPVEEAWKLCTNPFCSVCCSQT